MLCFDDEEQKDKTYSKTKASQIFYVSMLLFAIKVPLFCF